MTDDTPIDDIPSLYFLVDQAAEQIRRANYHTYVAREVTDLYPVLGALHALFSRFDQLATYLRHTVAQADPADFCHDAGDNVALVLADIHDGLTTARDFAAQVTHSVSVMERPRR